MGSIDPDSVYDVTLRLGQQGKRGQESLNRLCDELVAKYAAEGPDARWSEDAAKPLLQFAAAVLDATASDCGFDLLEPVVRALSPIANRLDPSCEEVKAAISEVIKRYLSGSELPSPDAVRALEPFLVALMHESTISDALVEIITRADSGDVLEAALELALVDLGPPSMFNMLRWAFMWGSITNTLVPFSWQLNLQHMEEGKAKEIEAVLLQKASDPRLRMILWMAVRNYENSQIPLEDSSFVALLRGSSASPAELRAEVLESLKSIHLDWPFGFRERILSVYADLHGIDDELAFVLLDSCTADNDFEYEYPPIDVIGAPPLKHFYRCNRNGLEYVEQFFDLIEISFVDLSREQFYALLIALYRRIESDRTGRYDLYRQKLIPLLGRGYNCRPVRSLLQSIIVSQPKRRRSQRSGGRKKATGSVAEQVAVLDSVPLGSFRNEILRCFMRAQDRLVVGACMKHLWHHLNCQWVVDRVFSRVWHGDDPTVVAMFEVVPKRVAMEKKWFFRDFLFITKEAPQLALIKRLSENAATVDIDPFWLETFKLLRSCGTDAVRECVYQVLHKQEELKNSRWPDLGQTFAAGLDLVDAYRRNGHDPRPAFEQLEELEKPMIKEIGHQAVRVLLCCYLRFRVSWHDSSKELRLGLTSPRFARALIPYFREKDVWLTLEQLMRRAGPLGYEVAQCCVREGSGAILGKLSSLWRSTALSPDDRQAHNILTWVLREHIASRKIAKELVTLLANHLVCPYVFDDELRKFLVGRASANDRHVVAALRKGATDSMYPKLRREAVSILAETHGADPYVQKLLVERLFAA